jgi:hypothetical protein
MKLLGNVLINFLGESQLEYPLSFNLFFKISTLYPPSFLQVDIVLDVLK